MVAKDITDLPARTIARTIRNQHPDTVVLTFLGPTDNGRVDLVETHGSRPLLHPFSDPQQVCIDFTRVIEWSENRGPYALHIPEMEEFMRDSCQELMVAR